MRVPSVAWWRRLAGLFLLVGIVLSPPRAEAATVSAPIAYAATLRPTAMVRVEAEASQRPEQGSVCEYVYDDAPDKDLCAAKLPMAARAGAIQSYDGILNLAESSELGEGVIYAASAVTVAAEGALSTRALTAADLGLSGTGITNLAGEVVNAGTTRIINVGNITATRGALVGELRGALPNILGAARAEGVRTLQITASFANPGLADFAASQAAQYGGMFSSVSGQETLTFILGAP